MMKCSRQRHTHVPYFFNAAMPDEDQYGFIYIVYVTVNRVNKNKFLGQTFRDSGTHQNKQFYKMHCRKSNAKALLCLENTSPQTLKTVSIMSY